VGVARLPARSLRRGAAKSLAVQPPSGSSSEGVGRMRSLFPLVTLAVLAGCAGQTSAVPPPRPLPVRIVPDRVGAYTVQAEPAAEQAYVGTGASVLVDRGRVFSLRRE